MPFNGVNGLYYWLISYRCWYYKYLGLHVYEITNQTALFEYVLAVNDGHH